MTLSHGHSSPKNGSQAYRAYRIWIGMRQRSGNPNHKDWDKYGGRGICVCERWQNFQNFLTDMGEPPAGTSIDRINNDGNYEPNNCRWATPTEQIRNTRTFIRDGKARAALAAINNGKSLAEITKAVGISMTALQRIRRGQGRFMELVKQGKLAVLPINAETKGAAA